ncbi:hypothetical protein [Enterococcus casseliflavus]|uniref:hypothetical protein n=1 Tax=Enterococcus casseliflavus TaxID=37734 RepID=UPI0018838D1E|nr:hypothetical protein [Enterococcus casseliflavus]MBE9909339.1 hypothetical protein [Enterococcus casseliflavus]
MKKIVNSVGVVALLSFGILAGCTREQQKSNSSQINISSNSSSVVADQSDGQSSNIIEESQLEENNEPDNSFPYSVDLNQYSSPLNFYLKGSNVPSAITIKNTDSTVISIDDNVSYEAEAVNIPTKEIRIFSHDNNEIRSVKVNTELKFKRYLKSNGNSDFEKNMYLFTNNDGDLSLATPNYAGNVDEEQQDVLLEALQDMG